MTGRRDMTARLFDVIADFSEGTITTEDAWRIAADTSAAIRAAIEAEGK